jgi:hypothetical protein
VALNAKLPRQMKLWGRDRNFCNIMHGPTTELALPMKCSPWVLAIYAALALCGVVKLYNFFTDPMISETQPIENADGTIDYTLFDQWVDHPEPYFWILRLPADQYVVASQEWSANYKGTGGSYGFRARPNQYITLYFTDENFDQYMTKTDVKNGVSSVGFVQVSFQSTELRLTLDGGVNFTIQTDEEIARDCRVFDQSVPGLTRYVDAIDKAPASMRCSSLRDPVGITTYNVLRKADGLPVAGFDCIEGRARNGSSSCDGEIAVGGMREAQFRFTNMAFIKQMPQLQANLEAYVKRVTVRNEVSSKARKRLEVIKAIKQLK